MAVNTNRWDPILNYPGCMGVALFIQNFRDPLGAHLGSSG